MKFSEMSSIIRIVSVSALLVCCSIAEAKTYYVRVTGSDLAAGTTIGTAFQTIDKALTSAVSGDQIYVGAGTYTVESTLDGKKTDDSGWTMIFGDQDGAYTGDAGPVKIRSKTNRWAIQVRNCSYLYLYGLTFEAPEFATGNHYGIYARDISGYFYLNQCRFSGLTYGAYVRSTIPVYSVGSTYEGNTYGLYTSSSSFTYAAYCKFDGNQNGVRVNIADAFSSIGNQFNNCRAGLQATDVTAVTVESDTFTAGVSDDGGVAYNIPIRCTRSHLNVQNVRSTSPSYGILGYDLTGLMVNNCAFTEPKSYGLYASGVDMSVRNVTVDGAETQAGNGMRFFVTDENRPALENVKISGVSSGLIIDGSCDFQNVSVTGCRYGINYARGGRSLELDANSKVTLTDNGYGIYASHGSQTGGLLALDQFNVTDNNYGVYVNSAAVKFRDCKINGNSYGCYVANAPEVSVIDCEFDENVRAGGSTSQYGLNVGGESIEIIGSSFSKNRHGLGIRGQTDDPALLKDLRIDGNSYYGLLVAGGTAELSADDQLQITSNRYGIYMRNVTWTADGIDFGATNLYPCIDSGGSAKLKNCKVSGGAYGFHSSRSKVFDLQGCSVTGTTSYGIYAAYPETCRLKDVTATKCGNDGARLYTTDETVCTITDSVFSENPSSGLVVYGNTLDAENVKDLVCENNRFGIRVYNGVLSLDGDMNVQVSKNYYGVLVNNGDMRLDSFDLSGNEIGVYVYDGNIDATGCSISSSYHGMLLYPFDERVVNVSGCKVSGGTGYGVYISGYDSVKSHAVSDVKIDSFSGYGIYVRTARGDRPVVKIANAQISNCGTGIYSTKAELTVNGANITNSRSYGIYQNDVIGSYEDVAIDTAGSWGVIGYGPLMELTRVKVKDSRYGVALLVDHGNVINSVVDGGVYGVYINKVDGVFNVLQSTLANITTYGVLHYNGTATVENCIVDSANYGLRATGSSGSLTHDHTLVAADRTPFYGEMKGIDEINKDPIFKDPTNGDLSLAAGSPAINAGKDLSAVLLTDIEGNARPSYRQFEIGAYEYTEAAGSLRVLDWDETAK